MWPQHNKNWSYRAVRGCCKKLALPILSTCKSIRASGRGCHGFSPQATVIAITFICKLYQRKIDKPKQDACFL